MREIRPYGSAGGGTELNQSSLPRSSGTLRVLPPRLAVTARADESRKNRWALFIAILSAC
jgi:hypothetical protein